MNGSQHMALIASMRCVVCQLLDREQETRSFVHHIREDREPRNDFLTLPLCWADHQGPLGVHGDQTYLRMLKSSEWRLLAHVIQELNK